jgi:hypothetical protein
MTQTNGRDAQPPRRVDPHKRAHAVVTRTCLIMSLVFALAMGLSRVSHMMSAPDAARTEVTPRSRQRLPGTRPARLR